MNILFSEFTSRWSYCLIVTVIFTAVGILGINGLASANDMINQDRDVLTQKIMLKQPIDVTVGVQQAMMSIAVLSTVPINIEYLYGSNAVDEVNKNPVRPIAAGSYTLKAILEAIQRNYPKIRWLVVGQGVFVVFKETNNLEDPLDLRLYTKTTMTLSISDWTDWLYRQYRSSGFVCEIPHNNEPVSLSLSRSLTIREVFEKIAEQSQGHWLFKISQTNHIVSVDMKDGSNPSSSPIMNSKNDQVETSPTSTGDQWGRTRVRFFPRGAGSSAL